MLVVLISSLLVQANLNCKDSCKSCTSGYNYKSTNCLNFCPSGFFISGNICSPNNTQDLVTLNFVSYRKHKGSSIENFSHPEGFSFNNLTKVTPIATLDRGFYFFSSSYLVSNKSWVLAPSFCISIYLKAYNAGKILEVTHDSKTYLLIHYNNSNVIMRFPYLNITKDEEYKRSVPTLPGIWKLIYLNVAQYSNYLRIYIDGLDYEWRNYYEFRMDTDQAIFTLGAPNNSSFQGFLAYLLMKNSAKCIDNFLLSNNCGFNQYLSSSLCINCSDFTTEILFCTRNSSNLCYSTICDDCESYMYETCSENLTLNWSNPGKNCKSGENFNCSDCESGYNKSEGLCIYLPSDPSSIVLRLDDFKEFQGGYFQSGSNSSTYSPFKNPQQDDPMALSFRGYHFNSIQYMTAKSLILNHSFTVSVWALMTSRFFLSSKNFKLMSDSSVVLTLGNHDVMIEEYLSGNCSLNVWSFFGASVEWRNNSTHIRTFCGKYVSEPHSVAWMAFYDMPEEKNISVEFSSNFIYRVTFNQFRVLDFTDLLTICSTAGSTSCLAYAMTNYYTIFSINAYYPCHSSCTAGCSTWGTCNQCKQVQCRTCDNFGSSCVEDIEYLPCASDFHLSEDNQTCCRKRCSMCFGYNTYTCSKCVPGYVLVGYYCALACPTGYTLNGSVCVAPATDVMLNVNFDKIADNFSDVYGNQFFTGSSDEFYPSAAYHDPIPAKSRGFYFRNYSYIYTSNFTLSFNCTFAFWIWQKTPGILLTKRSLQINSTFTLKYLNNIYQMKTIPSQTWYQMNLGTTSNYVYFYFISLDGLGGNPNTPFNEFLFDDEPSPIYIGSSSFGFEGFLWKFMIYNKYVYSVGLITCNQTYVNNCYWNCSLDQYVENNTCQPCLNNCSNGCVRGSDCNLCLDLGCYQCDYFNDSCKKCVTNASKKIKCECDSGFYWRNDSMACKPCIDHCSKCTNSDFCQVCNINFTLSINNSCYCKSDYFIDNNSACRPCHELCDKCNGLYSSNCISCTTDKLLNNGSCVCKSGFYLSGLACLPCPYGCSECLNSTFCTSCENNFLKIDQNNSCPNTNYSGIGCCEKCHPMCLSCNGSSENHCLSCGFNQILTENQCICNISYYQVGFTCFYCDPLQNLRVLENKCICKEEYFNNSDQCSPCHNSCKTCKGPSEIDCLDCQAELNKTNNLCLCQTDQYWNGTNCSTCDASKHLIADYFNCKCKDGFFPDQNNTCLPCSLKCQTCSGESVSDCLTCHNHSYLNNSQCFCKDEYYTSDLTCLPCRRGCKKCLGPLASDCLCEVNKTWATCTCPTHMFWDIICHTCHSSCRECSGEQYFKCTQCSSYYLQGLCYESCPRGFQVIESECVVIQNNSLSFQFDSDSPLIERVSQKSAFFTSEKSKNHPFPLNNRGLFFPENSLSLIFKSSGRPFISPTFSISTWVKVMKNSEVLSIKSSEDFSIRFSISQNADFYLVLNKTSENFQFEIGSNSSNWHNYLLSVAYNLSYTFTPRVDGKIIYKIEIPMIPYKDSSSSILTFGSSDELMFSGFLYSFEIFTSEPLLDNLMISHKDSCKISPSALSECLDECLEYEYSSEGFCQQCEKTCTYGCINSTNCSPCFQEHCEICNILSINSCTKCENTYHVKNGNCVFCKDLEFFDYSKKKCEACPSLCLACFDLNHCLSCVGNSTLKESSYCECDFGFKKQERQCVKRYFMALLTISFSNVITITFDEVLQNTMNIEDLSLKVNSKEVEFLFTMKNISLYTIEIILDDETKKGNERELQIRFSKKIISIYGSVLTKDSFEFKLFYIPKVEYIEDLENMKESVKTLTTAASASALASGAILMNPTTFFNLLNLVEMFSYSLLFDITFHEAFIEFMMNLKKSTKLPSMELSIKKNDGKLPQKYILFGIESNIIINLFYLLKTQPFLDKKENYIMCINEVLLLFFYLDLIMAQIEIFYHSETISAINMKIVLATLGLNIFVNTIKSIFSIAIKIKLKLIRRFTKVIPIENLTSTTKNPSMTKID